MPTEIAPTQQRVEAHLRTADAMAQAAEVRIAAYRVIGVGTLWCLWPLLPEPPDSVWPLAWLAWATVYALFFWRSPFASRHAPRTIGAITSFIDALFVVPFVQFTGGPTSVFLGIFQIAIISVSFRFGLRGAAMAASVYGAGYIGVCMLSVQPVTLFSSVAYLNFLGLSAILGVIISREVEVRVESTRLLREQNEFIRSHLIEVAARESQLRDLLDAAPDALITVNESGVVVLANSQTKQLFGYAQEELLGQPIELLVPQAMRHSHAQLRQQYVADPQVRSMGHGRELYAQRKDGSSFIAEISLSPLKTPQGLLVTAAIRDVTERRQTMRNLAKAEAERVAAERETQQRDEFISIVAHELRTPLTSLGLSISSMRKLLDRGDVAKALVRLDLAARQLRIESQLVTNLLEVSRISAAHMVLNCSWVDMRTLVSDVLERLREDFAVSGASARVMADGDCRCWVDAWRVEQVMINLITNALKYAPGSPIEIRLRDSPEGLVCEVCDWGHGIAENVRHTLFERFMRGENMAQQTGLGLGLFISKQIVEAHGGTIGVERSGPEGTTFLMHLKGADQRPPLEGHLGGS